MDALRELLAAGGYLEAHTPNGGVIRLVEGANDNWDFFGGYHIWLRDRKGAHMIYVGAVSRSEDNPDLQEALGRFYSHR